MLNTKLMQGQTYLNLLLETGPNERGHTVVQATIAPLKSLTLPSQVIEG